jgi:hypothetical protein
MPAGKTIWGRSSESEIRLSWTMNFIGRGVEVCVDFRWYHLNRHIKFAIGSCTAHTSHDSTSLLFPSFAQYKAVVKVLGNQSDVWP